MFAHKKLLKLVHNDLHVYLLFLQTIKQYSRIPAQQLCYVCDRAIALRKIVNEHGYPAHDPLGARGTNMTSDKTDKWILLALPELLTPR